MNWKSGVMGWEKESVYKEKSRAINVRQQMHKIQDLNEFLEHSTVCSLLHTITSNNIYLL